LLKPSYLPKEPCPMYPLADASAAAKCRYWQSTDAAFWKKRLASLRSQATKLESQAAQQEAELHRLHNAITIDNDLCSSWQAQARVENGEEVEAQKKIENEEIAMSKACRRNAEVDMKRRSLLAEIADAKRTLGRQALSACEAADLGMAVKKVRGGTTARASELRASMQELGDKQAELVAAEEAERSKRRQLREKVRERLEEQASCQSELEGRLASRDAEMTSLREQLEASQAAERHALEESERFQQEAVQYEQVAAPRKALEREELRQQIQDVAAVHQKMLADLQKARERLWRKEQRVLEGGRPWVESETVEVQ